MRAFNLTDIETPALKKLGWLNVPIVVGKALIEPGCEAELEDNAMTRRDAIVFTAPGALALGSKPPAYSLAKVARENQIRLQAAEAAAKEKRKGK